MKKLTLFILSLIIMINIFGCKKKQVEPKESVKSPQEIIKVISENKVKYRNNNGDLPTIPIEFNKFLYSSKVNGIQLNKVEIGKINIQGGTILIGDPLYIGNEAYTHPLLEEFPIGNFPVYLVKADFSKYGQFGGERVALAYIQFSENKSVEWDLALNNYKGTPEFFNELFGVDSGLLSFSDYEIAKKYINKMTNHEGNFFEDEIVKGKKTYLDHYIYNVEGEGNIFLFSAGLGDGSYNAYIGYDGKGEKTALIIDMQLFNSTGTVFDGL